MFPEQNAKNEAASAKAAGISMYTIGIGNMIDSAELTAIADGSDHVIIIDDFRALSGDSVLQRLLSSMPSELKIHDYCSQLHRQ